MPSHDDRIFQIGPVCLLSSVSMMMLPLQETNRSGPTDNIKNLMNSALVEWEDRRRKLFII